MNPEHIEARHRSQGESVHNTSSPAFHSFILKVASRCNLNCPYCFVYNSMDQSWRDQPKFMSAEVALCAAKRIGEHLQRNNKSHALIVLHGGEPLLLGRDRLTQILDILRDELTPKGLDFDVGVQTNLLLLTEGLCELFLSRGVQVGVSLDGPPEVNDRYRLDHHGGGSAAGVAESLRLLTSDRYRKCFSGFLAVVHLDADPRSVIDYLDSWHPPSIDFLLPLHNHANPPKVRAGMPSYGDWLVRAFDYSLTLENGPRVRKFDSIVRLLLQRDSLVESIGLGANTLVVVESNGDIEGVDTLKSTYEGASALNLNVHENTFDEAAKTEAVRARQGGIESLCSPCQECELVSVCGGGYYPHRYSEPGSFDNPSVYCEDLQKLIRHVNKRLERELSLKGG